MEPDHERDEVESLCFCPGHESAKIAGAVLYVGIGQEQVAGVWKGLLCLPDPGLYRPHLAHPARGAVGRTNHVELLSTGMGAGELPGEFSGRVFALVVDENDVESSRVVLLEKRFHTALDALAFVACGNDRGCRGPAFRWLFAPQVRVQALVGLPEVSMEKYQVKPG